MWTHESMQLRTVCDKYILNVLVPTTSGNLKAKIFIDIQQTHFDGLGTKLLLLTFYDFLIHHLKKRKQSCF